MKTETFTNDSVVWGTIEEYSPKLGITCPIDLHIRKMPRYWGRCCLISEHTTWKGKNEPYPRPYIELTLDRDLVIGKHGMDKLRDVIIHELIHGTGNHTHNKHFYETARSLGIELEHENYKKFAACHR